MDSIARAVILTVGNWQVQGEKGAAEGTGHSLHILCTLMTYFLYVCSMYKCPLTVNTLWLWPVTFMNSQSCRAAYIPSRSLTYLWHNWALSSVACGQYILLVGRLAGRQIEVWPKISTIDLTKVKPDQPFIFWECFVIIIIILQHFVVNSTLIEVPHSTKVTGPL